MLLSSFAQISIMPRAYEKRREGNLNKGGNIWRYCSDLFVWLPWNFVGEGQQHLVYWPVMNKAFLFHPFFFKKCIWVDPFNFDLLVTVYIHNCPDWQKCCPGRKGAFVSDTNFVSCLTRWWEPIGCYDCVNTKLFINLFFLSVKCNFCKLSGRQW